MTRIVGEVPRTESDLAVTWWGDGRGPVPGAPDGKYSMLGLSCGPGSTFCNHT